MAFVECGQTPAEDQFAVSVPHAVPQYFPDMLTETEHWEASHTEAIEKNNLPGILVSEEILHMYRWIGAELNHLLSQGDVGNFKDTTAPIILGAVAISRLLRVPIFSIEDQLTDTGGIAIARHVADADEVPNYCIDLGSARPRVHYKAYEFSPGERWYHDPENDLYLHVVHPAEPTDEWWVSHPEFSAEEYVTAIPYVAIKAA